MVIFFDFELICPVSDLSLSDMENAVSKDSIEFEDLANGAFFRPLGSTLL